MPPGFRSLTTDVLAQIIEALEKVGSRPAFYFSLTKAIFMKKTDVQQQLKRAERQIANTSGGGHLGGTNFGQGYDAKTSSARGKLEKSRRNGGKN
ncbi:hypothetical protein SAMN02982989_0932 [Xaviernesmea oryzae]|uniref:Uncharacterized protein n=1 Tax=Xaviernesmea oryzae TaxID=464029 RepID=A0A1X7FVD8_9HYPH|nr:hypothetical protein SAMN02982989_0932 [Xaviernesmea oryzae]